MQDYINKSTLKVFVLQVSVTETLPVGTKLCCCCCFISAVNSYSHVWMASKPNHTVAGKA